MFMEAKARKSLRGIAQSKKESTMCTGFLLSWPHIISQLVSCALRRQSSPCHVPYIAFAPIRPPLPSR